MAYLPRVVKTMALGALLAMVPIGRAQEMVSDGGATLTASTEQALWDEAAALEAADRPGEAANRFLAVAEQFPASAKAAQAHVRAGLNLERVGRMLEAMTAYDAVIASGESGYWVEEALFYKAQACVGEGCTAEALAAINELKARYPDSANAVRAEIVQAALDGRDTSLAEELYREESQAVDLHKQALETSAADPAAAIGLLDTLVSSYPQTATALRARETKAHLLIRTGNRAAAFEEFAALAEYLDASTPGARIVQTAKVRMAAMYHAGQQRQQARDLYKSVVQSGDSPLAARAAVQIAGLDFEILQRQHRSGEMPVSAGQWDQMRQLCGRLHTMPFVKDAERVRADLMAVESYLWQGDCEQTVQAADAFLQASPAAVRQDRATALLFAGEALVKLRQYAAALPYYEQVIDLYPGTEEMWPRLSNVARANYRIWECLYRQKAPPEQIAAAADALLSRFPDSGYAGRVRFVMNPEVSR